MGLRLTEGPTAADVSAVTKASSPPDDLIAGRGPRRSRFTILEVMDVMGRQGIAGWRKSWVLRETHPPGARRSNPGECLRATGPVTRPAPVGRRAPSSDASRGQADTDQVDPLAPVVDESAAPGSRYRVGAPLPGRRGNRVLHDL